MMINETIILLTPYEDCTNHSLSKYIGGYLMLSIPINECFLQPLQRIFSNVIVYDYLKRMTEVGVKGVNREIIELVRREHPKYVLWVAFGEYYEIVESTFDAIRGEGSFVVGWFFDDDVRFDYYSKWWVPHIDYFVTNDFEAVEKYTDLGAKSIEAICTGLSVPCDWTKYEEKYDVSFIGSIRADRAKYIENLEEKNIPVHLFGLAGGKFLSYKEMMQTFSLSKINLNFSKTYKDMKLGIKARVFEVCLAGGFLLTEYAQGIERYFVPDKEIVYFNDADEMVEKVEYYLSNDQKRRAIARAAWERANREYTSFHLMDRVFRVIEQEIGTGRKEILTGLKMPLRIRRKASDYHFRWAVAFSLDNRCQLWIDSLNVAISYYPLNIRAWLWRIIGLLPSTLRSGLFWLYKQAQHAKE